MMKRFRKNGSIRMQFALIFIALMTCTIALYWIINTLFLEKYYTQTSQHKLVEAYYNIDEVISESEEISSENAVNLRRICNTGNINMAVVSPSMKIVFSTSDKDDLMVMRLLDHVFDYDFEKLVPSDNSAGGEKYKKKFDRDYQKKLLKTDDFEVLISRDPRMNMDYLELWGSIETGDFIIMRTTLAGIKESVGISNRFLGYIGIFMVIVCGVITWLITNKITKPILELANISERMAHLDFNAKYQHVGNNEIAILGSHMNELSETLEKTISELKTANNELKRDIEKKEKINNMRLEFLSNVAHELKTPIALVQGYAEGLKDNVNDDEESRNFYCDVIIDESQKMNQMVKNLMTLNQLEFGEDEVTVERFNIVELIRNYMQSSDIMLKQNGISANFEESEPFYVWADEFKVEEVFTNYFSNAIHYCTYPADNPESQEKRIEVTLEKKGDIVRISVFNTGNPIPEDSLDHLWEKFYKVDKARTHEYGGSGIGLSIVKAIMNAMNNNYGVTNYGNGVAFWFELDCNDEKT
ncbi:Signal transduction histidine kinase [Lachnospiraceae bacterium KH1T2]|nr:Signal transduction histidine kinase [Lachnospiraceae bacterium KH1T2]